MIFFLVLMGGKYILLQTTVFVVSVVGVLTPYMEIVQPESKELFSENVETVFYIFYK